ncbi:TetR family transcriptional regulator [Streptomyces polygonati]|uniref:TetR family transcriptional regulator n=1 Tax=Streptomyces polygonati TaxID=1617087 RepID=A0ABV8HMG4_9ACTN
MGIAEFRTPGMGGGRTRLSPAETFLRADARENRHRILDTARHLFAAKGIDIPMVAIAREAKVGLATLYRAEGTAP